MVKQAMNADGRQLLEATQQAVVGAADEVENVIEATTEEFEGHEPFYLSGEFWVAMAFVVAVVALYVPLKKAFAAFLNKYIQKETSRIDDAETLKEEARKILADYEQKLDNITAETQAVLARVEKNAEQKEKKELKDLESRLSTQEKAVKERVAAELAFAEKELSSVVVDKSISILEQNLKTNMDDVVADRLINQSIEQISKL